MTKERIEHTEESPKRQDAKVSKQQNVTRRLTVYMPEELAIQLEIYAIRHKREIRGGVSGVITKQVEKLLSDEKLTNEDMDV